MLDGLALTEVESKYLDTLNRNQHKSMAKNPFAGWMGNQSGNEEDNKDKNAWSNYTWAGDYEWQARALGLRRDPTVATEADLSRIYEQNLTEPITAFPNKRSSVEIGGPGGDLTPGEKIAKLFGVSLEVTGLGPLQGAAKFLQPSKEETGTFADIRRFSSDFLRSAAISGPQTIADVAGSIVDTVTGNTGRGQDYTLMGNAPQQYSSPGGVGQVLGSFVPDVVAGAGAFKLGARALTGMARKAAAGEATGLAGRIGGWAAAGSETPTALKMFGRAVSPAATRIERAAASLAAGFPAALNVAPEVVSGRMNPAEGALTVALNTAAGPLSAGQWGGRRLTNVLGDVAVNVGAQAATEFVPAIVPGGAEFDAQQVWKNLAYGAAMGTMFGLMNSKPLQGPGERATLGARVEQPQVEGMEGGTVTAGMKPKMLEIAQGTERALFGDVTLPDDATPEQTAQHLANMRSRSATELRSITVDENGNVSAFSDQYRAVEPPSAGLKNAVETERDIYANTLAARYADNPDALVRILDLEVAPGEITPENAQQVLAAKIKNEWLIQPVEGKGIEGVEQRLVQAGMDGVVQNAPQQFIPRNAFESGLTSISPEDIEAQQLTMPSVIPVRGQPFRAPESSTPAPRLLGTPTALGPVSPRVAPQAIRQVLPRTSFESAQMLAENPPTQIAGLLPDAELGPFNAVLIPRAGGPMQAPESTLRPEQIVDNAEQRLESAKSVAEEVNIPVESILTPESVEAKLYEAEKSGVPTEEAKAALVEEVAANPDSFVLPIKERKASRKAGAPAEQPILNDEAIAGIEAQQPKPKRPRKARAVAKTEADAEILEKIEGPESQQGSDVLIKEQTAAPSSEIGAEKVNNVASIIRSAALDVENAKDIAAAGKQQAQTEKRQLGTTGRAREIGRQTLRTRLKHVNSFKELLAGDMQMKIQKPGRGARYPNIEVRMAALAEMPVPAFRDAVHKGQTEFLDGMLRITRIGDSDMFNVSMNFEPDFKQRLANTYETVATKPIEPSVKAESVARMNQERIDKLNRRLYADLDEVFYEESTRGEEPDVPDGVSLESFNEAFDPEAGELDGYGQGQAILAKSFDDWRMLYKSKMKTAVQYVQKALEKSGIEGVEQINPTDIKYYIVSKVGPLGFSKVADLYVKNTMPANVRRILDDTFNGIISTKTLGVPKLVQPIKSLLDHNNTLDDSYFDARIDDYLPPMAEAMAKADTISTKIGINNPREIIAFVRWNESKGSAADKKNIIAKMTSLGRTPVEFDEAKAEFIRSKINPLLQNDAQADAAYTIVKKWVLNNRGAEAVQYILNENLMGDAKSYKLNLRNLPMVRNIGIVAAMMTLDEWAETIEDDETYAGFMPGKVLRNLLGDGQAGSVAMMYGGFNTGMKVRNKPGTKQGIRFRTMNNIRRMVDANSLFMGPTVSYDSMTPAQKSEAADMFMAQNRPMFKPGTQQYEIEKAAKIAAEELTAVKGGTLRNLFDGIAKDKAKGTISAMSSFINDPNLVAAKSQFVKDFIVKPYTASQSQIRRLVKKIEDQFSDVGIKYVAKYKNNRAFWDALWAMDYRMSQLDLGFEDNVSRSVIDTARKEVEAEIRDKYFVDKNNVLNEQMWADFQDLQTRIDPVRSEHYRSLIAESLGVNSWDIESHYAELLTTRDKLDEAIGAARAGYDAEVQRLDTLENQYKTFVEFYGKENIKEYMPDYALTRNTILRAKREHSRNMQKFQNELNGVNRKLEKIDTMDEAIAKSMTKRYMYRLRRKDAPLVLRIEFDPSSGIPSVRREYDSLSQAKTDEVAYLRDAVARMQATSPEYKQYVDKKRKITDRLEELDDADDLTPELESEYERLTAELDAIQGYKPVEQMTDAEVFRFASDYKQLGAQATVRDMRSRASIRKGSAAAQRVIDLVMSSAQPMQAQILTRTTDAGALIRPDTQQVDYVAGKGNQALFDNSASGQVMMAQGDQAPTVRDLVDAIDDMVDAPIDRRQLSDLIERYYTYRDESTNAAGTSVETVWIDMAAMRKIVEAYTDPYIPNLIRRNNWIGYYDPDGTWTTKERIDYTIKSIEAMQSQVRNSNQRTALRKAINDANDYLDRYDIRNGMREYINGLQAYNDNTFKGGIWDSLGEYEMKIRRGISFATLATNLGSALSNRLAGASIAVSHGIQNATTKYGVYENKPDGTRGPVKWMPNEMSARAELYKLQQENKGSYSIAEGFISRPFFDPKTYGLGVAAIMAPHKTLQYLAKRDGYGVVPPSQYGKWATLYDQAQAARLYQGGIVGSYTHREGINAATLNERALESLGALTDFVERTNNFSSILMSGLNIENRFGLTDSDWLSMNSGQKTDAVKAALAPYRERLDTAGRARVEIQKQIDEVQKQIAEIADMPAREQERLFLEKQLASKQERLSSVIDDKQLLLDALTDYMVYDRNFEQGAWSKLDKSQFERMIESYPGGKLAMTMTAPILRSYNSWSAMMRTASKTEGGRMQKLGRAAGPIMGASILTILLGYSANPLTVAGGIFFTDIAALGEMLYAYWREEDGEKLDKIANRQAWEKIAEDLAPRHGIDPEDAKNFVRATWSEGLIKYLSVTDASINAGAGIWDITGGGTPAQVVLGLGKGAYDASKAIISKSSEGGTAYDIMYAFTSAAPTSIKRIAQTGLQAVPSSLGGFGAVKVDKFGQPIYDKDQKLQPLSGWDVARNTFLGKRWSETRSKLIMYEGGTPLYTENDRVAWANDLTSTKYVQFGKSSKAAMQGKGTAEQTNAAFFERDAVPLQRAISQQYATYKPAVDAAKNAINQMYRDNAELPLTNDGSVTMPFREILSITAAGGTKVESEIKGSAPDEIRKSLLKTIDDWGRSRAAAEAVQAYYGGSVAVYPSADLYDSESGEIFALRKLGSRFGTAYRDYQARQLGRRSTGR